MSISSAITITDNAADKVWSLMTEEENYDLLLRAYITGGGCSGFQYGFTFEEQANADDTPTEKATSNQNGKVTLIIDPISMQYLKDAEIDYVTDVKGERFVIRNPNAKTTCGCGSSFSA